MNLSNISATNIKGRSFDLPLAAANVLIGSNAAGKTAVINAIQLALLGSVPGHDKTNGGVFELSSGAAMKVCATTDTIEQVERAWLRKPDGGVGYNQRITSPTLASIPVVMLDANEFLGATERKQLEAIFSVMNLSDTPLKMRVDHTKDQRRYRRDRRFGIRARRRRRYSPNLAR